MKKEVTLNEEELLVLLSLLEFAIEDGLSSYTEKELDEFNSLYEKLFKLQ